MSVQLTEVICVPGKISVKTVSRLGNMSLLLHSSALISLSIRLCVARHVVNPSSRVGTFVSMPTPRLLTVVARFGRLVPLANGNLSTGSLMRVNELRTNRKSVVRLLAKNRPVIWLFAPNRVDKSRLKGSINVRYLLCAQIVSPFPSAALLAPNSSVFLIGVARIG